jgi:hypothetical protein
MHNNARTSMRSVREEKEVFTKKSALLAACLIALLLCSCIFAAAQQNAPEVSQPDRFDISPPLRDVPIVSTPSPGPFKVMTLRHPRPVKPESAVPQQPDTVLQNTPGSLLTATPGISFTGVGVGLGNYSDCCAPPDTNMAVGPNHIVQWVNLDYAIFDKSGNLLPGFPKPGNSFWSGFGGICETSNSGDPIAQYDAAADRWVMSQLAASGSTFAQCFAVSRTNDPTGSYARYAYSFGNSLNDYPKIGVWPSGYFAAYNMFLFGAFFQGAKACAYDRTAMLAANSTATQICFQKSADVIACCPQTWMAARLHPADHRTSS